MMASRLAALFRNLRMERQIWQLTVSLLPCAAGNTCIHRALHINDLYNEKVYQTRRVPRAWSEGRTVAVQFQQA